MSFAAIAVAAFSIWMLYLVYQAIRTGETRARHYGHLIRDLNPLDFYLVAGVRFIVGVSGMIIATILTCG